MVSVTVCEVLVVPTSVSGKVRLGERVAVGCTPLPERLTVSEPAAVLSLIVSVADWLPAVVGEKITPMSQELLAARLVLVVQVVVLESTAKVVPLTAKLLIFSVSLPLLVLVIVTVSATLLVPTRVSGKERLVDERPAVTDTPVPERLTVWEPLPALSLIVSVPVRLVAVGGEKVTPISQELLAARVEPQVVVPESTAKLALALMLLMSSVAELSLLVLDNVTVIGLLVEPTSVSGKLRLVDERSAVTVIPVPVKPTFTVMPASLMFSEAVSAVPVVLGVKLTLTEHELPDATVWSLQVSVEPIVKSLALVPEMDAEPKLRAVVP